MTAHQRGERTAQHRGLRTILVLAVLTLIEYAIAIGVDSTQIVVALLSVIAVTKALLIGEYFMHCSRLWSAQEGH